MSIGSIGSSFGTISPATVTRETAQSARADESQTTAADTLKDAVSRLDSGASLASSTAFERLSDSARSATLRVQEAAPRAEAHPVAKAHRAYAAAGA